MMKKQPPRFVEIYTQKTEGTTKVLVDMMTGVNYLYHQNGYSGGLTVLCNPDGSPVVTPPQTLFPALYPQGRPPAAGSKILRCCDADDSKRKMLFAE